MCVILDIERKREYNKQHINRYCGIEYKYPNSRGGATT